MTREEAIELLREIYCRVLCTDQYGDYMDSEPYEKALEMAIDALEQEPVLDKIREEIDSLSTYGVKFTDGLSLHIDKYSVLQIIDKYKAESEDKE